MTWANDRLTELPVPEFYRTGHASSWSFGPDHSVLLEAAVGWRQQHGIAPALGDRPRIDLLLIDAQKDFCFPEGTLFVGGRGGRGAIHDSDRTARFIYRNLGAITRVTCTLDTHTPHQIFSPSFWLQEDGAVPGPNREVEAADILEGRLRPNPALAGWLAHGDYDWLLRQAAYYCEELERKGKYKLYLWPPHCLLGSAGYDLAGVIQEARMFHAYARETPAPIVAKGDTPLTEYYSVLGPEVTTTFDGRVLAERNEMFLSELLEADAVIIAGQAASHCVKSTVEDLLTVVSEDLARKVYLMRDCMSAVAVPDPARPGSFLFDFTDQAEAALRRFREAGMHVVESTTPLAEWPDLPL
jgi:nicotinamidase-related amidase